MNKVDFSLLKMQIIFIGITFLLTTSVIVSIHFINETTNEHLELANQRLSEASGKLHQRMVSIKIYKQWNASFSILKGFSFQKSDKLRWMEKIQEQSDQLHIPSVVYNIKASHIDPQLKGKIKGNYTLYSTDIKVVVGLLHEEQLLDFFDHLVQSELGVFTINQCDLLLNEKEKGFQKGKANITAQCLIKWYEVSPKPEPKPMGLML